MFLKNDALILISLFHMPWVWPYWHNTMYDCLYCLSEGGGEARKYRGVTKVWWWFTFEPTCLEQTLYTFLDVMVLVNHSQACDSFAAVCLQKLWQLPGINF